MDPKELRYVTQHGYLTFRDIAKISGCIPAVISRRLYLDWPHLALTNPPTTPPLCIKDMRAVLKLINDHKVTMADIAKDYSITRSMVMRVAPCAEAIRTLLANHPLQTALPSDRPTIALRHQWLDMMARCYVPQHAHFTGLLTVHPPWRDFNDFSHTAPKHHHPDCPTLCLLTGSEYSHTTVAWLIDDNAARSDVVHPSGLVFTLSQAATRMHVAPATLAKRLAQGMTDRQLWATARTAP